MEDLSHLLEVPLLVANLLLNQAFLVLLRYMNGGGNKNTSDNIHHSKYRHRHKEEQDCNITSTYWTQHINELLPRYARRDGVKQSQCCPPNSSEVMQQRIYTRRQPLILSCIRAQIIYVVKGTLCEDDSKHVQLHSNHHGRPYKVFQGMHNGTHQATQLAEGFHHSDDANQSKQTEDAEEAQQSHLRMPRRRMQAPQQHRLDEHEAHNESVKQVPSPILASEKTPVTRQYAKKPFNEEPNHEKDVYDCHAGGHTL
mmetsp:Transcript_21677/g.50685  ORF Transcript_21677/g.50685 Transcript_21677/m.50685 type:complete len:255 (-) Transcript_21677:904-1668(-)